MKRFSSSVTLWVGFAVLCLHFVCSAGVVLAEDNAVIYWRVESDTKRKMSERFLNNLKRTLSQAEEKHLLTDSALIKHLKSTSPSIPLCYEGARPCEDNAMQMIELLAVDGFVKAHLRPKGDTYELTLRYWRSTGGTPKEITRQGSNLRDLARESVGELFTLEAFISITTAPDKAQVFINSQYIGDAPVEARLGEGKHALRAEFEGYEIFRENIVLLPGEQRAIELKLQPRLTQVTVLTNTPKADLYVDGMFRGPAGEPVDVSPGKHELELQAPGFEPIGMPFSIAPAQRLTYQFAMLSRVLEARELRERSVAPYHIYLRPYFNASFQDAHFSEGTLESGGSTFRATQYASEGRASLSYKGLGVAAGYTQKTWGLMFIDLSLGWSSLSSVTFANDTDDTFTSTNSSASRFALRALHGTARRQWGAFSVEGSTGFGVGFDTFALTAQSQDFELAETQGFWSLRGAARYHLSGPLFAELSYRVEVDFGGDRSLRQGLGLGLGYYLPWAMTKQGEGSFNPGDLPEEDEELPPLPPTLGDTQAPSNPANPSTITPPPLPDAPKRGEQ